MRKIALLIAACATCLHMAAQNQTAYDALLASSSELNGTARFMAVGGALGAIGGDASTIFYNPAGIGIYRSSELTLSINVDWANTTLSDMSNPHAAYNTHTNFNLQHAAYVGTWNFEKEKGLLNFNFGIAYNQAKKFSREGYYHGNQPHSYTQWIAGMTDGIGVDYLSRAKNKHGYNPAYDNSDIPWGSVLAYDSYLTDLKYTDKNDIYQSLYDWNGGKNVNKYIHFQEEGVANDFAISFAGNISNILYWGMTFECDYGYYSRRTTMQERFDDGSVYSLHTKYGFESVGFTYKIGLIARPTNWLRIGASFHTPTVFSYKDHSNAICDFEVYDVGGVNRWGTTETPYVMEGSTNLTGPLKAMASLGFVLGQYGFVGIDYEYENTSAINGNDDHIKDFYRSVLQDRHTIRAGIEVKPLEGLALRVGGGYSLPSTPKDMYRVPFWEDTRVDTEYYNETASYNVTAGIGYRVGRHAIDLAYVWQVNTADYYSYSPGFTKYDGSYFNIPNVDPINMRTVRNQLVLTYGIRF